MPQIPEPDNEWVTLREAALLLGYAVTKVRVGFRALSAKEAIRTRQRPGDQRIVEIHRASLDRLRHALESDEWHAGW